jgi:Ca2+/Na+ antiporter
MTAIVGAFMKLMHWPLGSLILFAGLLPTPIVYGIHFLQKQVKSRLDILKLVWVEFFFLIVIMIFCHFPFRYPFIAIEGLLFLMLYAAFAYRQYRPRPVGEAADL